jgi:hypothetical protein
MLAAMEAFFIVLLTAAVLGVGALALLVLRRLGLLTR